MAPRRPVPPPAWASRPHTRSQTRAQTEERLAAARIKINPPFWTQQADNPMQMAILPYLDCEDLAGLQQRFADLRNPANLNTDSAYLSHHHPCREYLPTNARLRGVWRQRAHGIYRKPRFVNPQRHACGRNGQIRFDPIIPGRALRGPGRNPNNGRKIRTCKGYREGLDDHVLGGVPWHNESTSTETSDSIPPDASDSSSPGTSDSSSPGTSDSDGGGGGGGGAFQDPRPNPHGPRRYICEECKEDGNLPFEEKWTIWGEASLAEEFRHHLCLKCQNILAPDGNPRNIQMCNCFDPREKWWCLDCKWVWYRRSHRTMRNIRRRLHHIEKNPGNHRLSYNNLAVDTLQYISPTHVDTCPCGNQIGNDRDPRFGVCMLCMKPNLTPNHGYLTVNGQQRILNIQLAPPALPLENPLPALQRTYDHFHRRFRPFAGMLARPLTRPQFPIAIFTPDPIVPFSNVDTFYWKW